MAGRNNCAVIDTNLNTSALQSVTQCEAASDFSTDERGLGHTRQNSTNVSVTVHIASCVGITHCRGIYKPSDIRKQLHFLCEISHLAEPLSCSSSFATNTITIVLFIKHTFGAIILTHALQFVLIVHKCGGLPPVQLVPRISQRYSGRSVVLNTHLPLGWKPKFQ